VLTPAGLEKSTGLVTAQYIKDPVDPQFKDDAAMKEWLAFMAKYYPEGDIRDNFNVYGYTAALTLAQALKQCGDTLTRDNVMKQAASLDLSPGTLQPGVKINTSATDFFPIKQMKMERFTGERWELFGPVISGDIGS